MSGVGDLSLLSPRSRIFVVYPDESVHIFKRILSRLVGDLVRWKSAGGSLGLLLEYLGSLAGSRDRREFGTDHNAQKNGRTRTVDEAARDGHLVKRRRRDSKILSRGPFPRVMFTSSRAPAVLPIVVVPRDRECVLPLSSHPTSPAHCGFSRGIDELAGDIFGRDVGVIQEEDFLGDMGIRTRGDVSRIRSPQVVYHENVSWRGKRFRTQELFSHGGRRFGASGDGSNRVPSMLSRTSAGNLELIKELGYGGRSEDETHARVLPFLYCSIHRRFC